MSDIHQRTLIRRQVIAMLQGNTDAEDRIFPNRVLPLWVKELPAICVYTLDDDPKIEFEAPRTLKHALDLVVDLTIMHEEGADDVLDGLCKQVESAMMQDDTIGGTAIDCILGSTKITISSEGQQQVLSAKISFDVSYRSEWPEEITGPNALTDFTGMDTQIQNTVDGTSGAEIDSTVQNSNS